MGRWIKRFVKLALLGAVIGVVLTVLQRRRRESMPGATHVPSAPFVATAPTWVPPVDGACPAGYPIKANGTSSIYHVPEGRWYQRTVAERCYATAEAAERDGYRRAKA